MLEAKACPSINTLPKFPPNIKEVHLEGCINLIHFPKGNFPNSLKYLNLTDTELSYDDLPDEILNDVKIVGDLKDNENEYGENSNYNGPF